MTVSTKPEIHNVSQLCRGGPSHRHNLAKFGYVIFELCDPTDRQTDRQTDILLTIPLANPVKLFETEQMAPAVAQCMNTVHW